MELPVDPAEVVAAVLRTALGSSVKVKTQTFPDQPDKLVFVRTTSAVPDGRYGRGGRVYHPGCQVQCRGKDYDEGRSLASSCVTALVNLNNTGPVVVTVGTDTITVTNVSVVGLPLPMAEEADRPRRSFTFNLTFSFQG